jgi:hypothetical protein
MFYLNLTGQFLFKMAQIWLPLFIGVLTLLVITTKFMRDSSWLKKLLRNTYKLMEGKKYYEPFN